MTPPPTDVAIMSSAAAILSSLSSIPQLAKIIREPAAVRGLSAASLWLQTAVAVLFVYVNARLDLVMACAENVLWSALILAVIVLKYRDEQQRLIVPAPTSPSSE